ncbi:MAG: putative sulfate exporter family transporter [Chloroflexi bacterium]|nr:putative sulfate exporter family transporter [Chloroflexota bacterium]
MAVAKSKRLSFWEDALLGCPGREVLRLLPGVALAGAIVFFSIWLADWINASWGFKGVVSHIMVAIIVGIAVRNTVGLPSIATPGVNFCVRKLLRLGIIAMGIRLSIFDAIRIGAWGIPIVVISIVTGLIVTTYFTRLLRLSDRLSTLIAVGTGICGASAIVATAPAIEAKDEEVTYAVANITIFGILAMLLYPYLANFVFQGNLVMAGLFSGTSIHETAQVTGAGLIYDQIYKVTSRPSVADVAVVTKLVRNVFMAIVIPLMAYIYARRIAREGKERSSRINALSLFPLFILGFVAMAAIRSFGDASLQDSGQFLIWNAKQWQGSTSAITYWSGNILAVAMAGVGLGTAFNTLRGLGIRPFYVGLFSAAMVGLSSVIIILLLGPAVHF